MISSSTCSQAQPTCSEAQHHTSEGGGPCQVPTRLGPEDAQQTALQDFPHTHQWKRGTHTRTKLVETLCYTKDQYTLL